LSLVVSTRSAVCTLDRFPALAGVDLDVERGEVVLLSGGNGSGKTTLLRVLAGLLPLRAGSAEVLGVDLRRDRRSHRARLALVGHETGCYDDLTVAENVTFFLRAAGGSGAAIEAAMEQLDLTRLAPVPHGRLSAGQRRRVALAIALARDPELLLLDEPHAGLDVVGREVLDAMLAGAGSDGRTVIIASHELDRARALATREVELVSGRAIGGRREIVPPARAPRPGEVRS
jgi:heme ABC exporter ATP-binding subunit CcmA